MIGWFLFFACNTTEPDEATPQSIDHRVAWSPVESPDSVPVATLAAEVLPAPGSSVRLGPAAAGRIVRWHVAPGDEVQAGQPLADLASPVLSAAKGRIQTLAAQVREGRAALDLAEAAAAGGVGSQREVQVARTALGQTQAALRGARQELEAFGGIQEGGELAWTSPITGIVGEIVCPVGPVAEGTECLSVQRDRAVLLQVRVPERHMAALQGASTAAFISLSGATASFAETSRAPQLDPATRSLLLQYTTTDAILAGSAGRAVISAPRPPDLRVVPRAALTRMDGTDIVFVRGTEKPEARAVRRVGGDANSWVVAGLEGVDEVATTGVFLLKSLAQLEAE